MQRSQPTHNGKILVATVREYEYKEVNHHILELIKGSFNYDVMHFVAAMKSIFPEFISINSPFVSINEMNSISV